MLDYPAHIAATVFTGGCNFRCPFCHNGGLVLRPDQAQPVDEEEVLAYLKKRKGILEGVCITGGEPTLQPGLKEFMRRVKEEGYRIKLDTNGYTPHILRELLEEGLPDYVAMDVKASLPNYARAAGCPDMDLSRIQESIGILKSGKVPFEFRTTVVKGIHTVEEFDAVGRLLAGSPIYYLQCFRDSGNVIQEGFCAFLPEEMEKMADMARKYIDKVELRGVE